MMTYEKTKASALTGIGVFTVMFLVMIFNQSGDNPVGYCEETNEICIAIEGFSGGEHTRCYNATDMNWWDAPYCKEGWVVIDNDLPDQKEIEPEPEQNNIIQEKVGKVITCKEDGCNTDIK